MTRNTKIFLASFFLSAFLGLFLNATARTLTNVFFWNEITKNSDMLTAQILQENLLHQEIAKQKPTRIPNTPAFTTGSKSAFSVFVSAEGRTKTLFEKNSETPFPIASITKLMTALVVLQNYSLDQEITMSKTAIDKEESIGNFKIGEKITAKDLLYSILIESSNDAAQALSEFMGEKLFVQRMNEQRKIIGLEHAFFADPAGVDPTNQQRDINVSSAKDLALLLRYILQNYPQMINILSLHQYNLYTLNGTFHHTMKNTNELLGDASLPFKVLGGKTGWTPNALGCLILLSKSPSGNGYIITVALGSENRFDDIKQLLAWTAHSYDF